MARKYHLTREDAKEIIKNYRKSQLPQLIIVGTNKDLNKFQLIHHEELEQVKAPVILRYPLYNLFGELGILDKIQGMNIGEVFEWLPSKAWGRLEDIVYNKANEFLATIKRLGYVPTQHERNHIDGIIKIASVGVKDKNSKLSKINKVSKEQLGLSDEEWALYSSSDGRAFIGEDGLERDSIFNAFQVAVQIMQENPNIGEDEDLERGVKYFSKILDRVSRAKKTHVDILYEGFKGLVHQVGRKKNRLALNYIESAMSTAVNRRTRFERKVKDAMGFKQRLDEYDIIESIQPIIYNSKPYVLVSGDLDKMYYRVTEGRNYYMNPMSQARGVTELDTVLERDNKTIKYYRVTLNAFRDISINDDFGTRYIKYEGGEWDKYYESGSKVSLKLTPAFVREVDESVNLTVVNYNANREGINALGDALPFWRTDVFEYGQIYDNADSVYEDIMELYYMLPSNSHAKQAISDWKRGYDVRHGNSESFEEYVEMAKEINRISKELEPEVVAGINNVFKTNFATMADVSDRDLNFGLDSGFAFIEYVDNGKKEESREFQRIKGAELIDPERAVTIIPRVQSKTMKDYVGRNFIKEISKRLPKEWELRYYSRLD